MAARDQCKVCGCLLEPHEIPDGECDHCFEGDNDRNDDMFDDEYLSDAY